MRDCERYLGDYMPISKTTVQAYLSVYAPLKAASSKRTVLEKACKAMDEFVMESEGLKERVQKSILFITKALISRECDKAELLGVRHALVKLMGECIELDCHIQELCMYINDARNLMKQSEQQQ